MTILATVAVVLHQADYLESSRLFRLATREGGMLSVVARGARNSRRRFGSAVGLFAIGHAEIDMRPNRDLHTLIGYDVTRTLDGIAADLSRFSAAAAYAECALRVIHDEAAPTVFDGVVATLEQLNQCPAEATTSLTLGALWRLVRDVGFAPALDVCAECHAEIDQQREATFSHVAGGVLCDRCGRRSPGGRKLPASAQRAVREWLDGGTGEGSPDEGSPDEISHGEARAHQRLLREFLEQHLHDRRPPRAYLAWESELLSAPALGTD